MRLLHRVGDIGHPLSVLEEVQKLCRDSAEVRHKGVQLHVVAHHFAAPLVGQDKKLLAIHRLVEPPLPDWKMQ